MNLPAVQLTGLEYIGLLLCLGLLGVMGMILSHRFSKIASMEEDILSQLKINGLYMASHSQKLRNLRDRVVETKHNVRMYRRESHLDDLAIVQRLEKTRDELVRVKERIFPLQKVNKKRLNIIVKL